ncbi:Acyltransferase 3 [Lasallia pustulata]|uniref:Acyltransferase 3 n=1 Tax=Lasallia pustulata TaxID=136370 RepID=A0A1W5D9D9_9LECA|nr:Acyltransferase 3 [Lasallia pustulata]
MAAVTITMIRTYARRAEKSFPSFQLSEPDDVTSKKALQDSSWADGLRGLAAVFVVSSHMVIAFCRHLMLPSGSENGPPQLFQRPFFRLISQGSAWVAIFFILSGYVNALKPVKLARAGNVDTALSNLAVSSFRRSFRLFLPGVAATVLSWFLCQLGAYETARRSDAYWLYATSPGPSDSWGTAVEDLVAAIRMTWKFRGENPYDQPQWCMFWLLLASMIVFMTLVATVNLTPTYRVLIISVLYFLSWDWTRLIGDPFIGINVYAGILLAELSHSTYPASLMRYTRVLSPLLCVLGFYLCSFPSAYPNNAAWSRNLVILADRLFPDIPQLERFWPTLGAQIVTLSVIFSPALRRMLSHRFLLWLGKVSFPLYLLHGTFMRSLLAWVLYGGRLTVETEEWDDNVKEHYRVNRIPAPRPLVFFFVLPLWAVVVLSATHLWAVNVEPWFGVITAKCEDMMFGREGRSTALPVRMD